MNTLVFDIETVGEDFDALDETSQHMLTRWLEREGLSEEAHAVKLKDIKEGLGFSPLTGEIVAIGTLHLESERGAVYFSAPDVEIEESEHKGIALKPMSEKEQLEKFWEIAESCNTFVSFNGRGFDAPFMALRSAIHGIRPSKNLLSNRYLSSQFGGAKHVDLLDQLTFYGAFRGRGSNLHLFTRAFGIESPKAGGVDGDDVAALYREGKYLDIAKYNVDDIVATMELYKKWVQYLQ